MLWFYTSKSKSSLLNLNLFLLIFMMMTKTTSAEEQNNFYHKSAGECKNVKITKFWDDEESVWASEGRWRESQSKENTNNWVMRGFLFLSVFHFLFWNTEWRVKERKRRKTKRKQGNWKIEWEISISAVCFFCMNAAEAVSRSSRHVIVHLKTHQMSLEKSLQSPKNLTHTVIT